LHESRKDIKEGKFHKESVEKHVKRITRGWDYLYWKLY
jgi:hypothetical protein